MKKITLLLVEDNRLLREGIASLIKGESDFQVVASLGASDDIVAMIRKRKPNVMLLDLGVKSQNSLELAKSSKIYSPATKIIVMDLIPTQTDILQFVRAGVSGFILKDATIPDFLSTIRSVVTGGKVLPPLLSGSLFSQIADHAVNGTAGHSTKLIESVRMTMRERQVVSLVSKGMTNKEIAHNLHLSTYTVKSHIHNILEKLALHTRIQIAKYAHASGSSQEVLDSISLMDEDPKHSPD